MNTTTAATQAHVTVATIRTWCRTGVIAAIKQAGRWVIDTASLTHRIAIGAMKRPAKTITFTADNLVAIGGRRWTKNGKDRVYINDWASFAGLETSHYNSGNVSGARFQGRSIANGRVGGIISAIDGFYFDVAEGRFFGYWTPAAREFEIRYRDGERDYLDLVSLTIAGLRAAVAAL